MNKISSIILASFLVSLTGVEGCPKNGIEDGCPEGTVDMDIDGFCSDVDCDDTDATINPDASELCNGFDDNCDGLVDEDDPTLKYGTWAYEDSDGDGYGNSVEPYYFCGVIVGYVLNSDDCDDTDADINPGVDEICNEIDDDCDGTIDEDDATDALTWYLDDDGDGYGDSSNTTESCDQPSGYVSDDTDCDDGNLYSYPGAIEFCDGEDNDCDELTDEDDPDLVNAVTWYLDDDGDGYGDPDEIVEDCDVLVGYVLNGDDCDDDEADINPDADEICDFGVDNNCDGRADDYDSAVIDQLTWYRDVDGDGFGDVDIPDVACDEPSGYVDDDTDCDDTDADINPDADEICNEFDDDCDGDIDDDDPDILDQSTWYLDDDGDGYGDPDKDYVACFEPSGYTDDDTDCDDTDADINSDADEVCDEVDNNCDGDIDEDDAIDALTWYLDVDGDGYGDDDVTDIDCDQPTNFVEVGGDCAPTDDEINPDADEVCDEVDNDCDGDIDEDDAIDALTWYLDADGDGYGDSTETTEACDEPSGYVDDDTDCDDTDEDINPDADEICNELDDDCDGYVDDDDSDVSDQSTWYLDDDGDGYGDSAETTEACDEPSGYTSDDTDCDDTDADINPDADENVYTVWDEDCDGYAHDDGTSYTFSDGSGSTLIFIGENLVDQADSDFEGWSGSSTDWSVEYSYYSHTISDWFTLTHTWASVGSVSTLVLPGSAATHWYECEAVAVSGLSSGSEYGIVILGYNPYDDGSTVFIFTESEYALRDSSQYSLKVAISGITEAEGVGSFTASSTSERLILCYGAFQYSLYLTHLYIGEATVTP